jgi:hypothetical protein
MTKKDYIAMAAALRPSHASLPLGEYHDIVERCAAMFKADNPRFDKGRFIRACYPDPKVTAA